MEIRAKYKFLIGAVFLLLAFIAFAVRPLAAESSLPQAMLKLDGSLQVTWQPANYGDSDEFCVELPGEHEKSECALIETREIVVAKDGPAAAWATITFWLVANNMASDREQISVKPEYNAPLPDYQTSLEPDKDGLNESEPWGAYIAPQAQIIMPNANNVQTAAAVQSSDSAYEGDASASQTHGQVQGASDELARVSNIDVAGRSSVINRPAALTDLNLRNGVKKAISHIIMPGVVLSVVLFGLWRKLAMDDTRVQ